MYDKKISPYASFILALNDAASLGFLPKIGAAGEAAFAKLTRPELFEGRSFSDLYHQSRDYRRDINKKGANENPFTSFLGQLSGGVATPWSNVGGGAFSKILKPWTKEGFTKNIGQAAVQGGLYGLGTTDTRQGASAKEMFSDYVNQGLLQSSESGLLASVLYPVTKLLPKGKGDNKLTPEQEQAAALSAKFNVPIHLDQASQVDSIRAEADMLKSGSMGLPASNLMREGLKAQDEAYQGAVKETRKTIGGGQEFSEKGKALMPATEKIRAESNIAKTKANVEGYDIVNSKEALLDKDKFKHFPNMMAKKLLKENIASKENAPVTFGRIEAFRKAMSNPQNKKSSRVKITNEAALPVQSKSNIPENPIRLDESGLLRKPDAQLSSPNLKPIIPSGNYSSRLNAQGLWEKPKSSIDFHAMESWYQGNNKAWAKLPEGSDKTALGILQKEYKKNMDNVFDEALISGDSQIWNDVKNAQGLFHEWAQKYRNMKPEEFGDTFIAKIAKNRKEPLTYKQISNLAFGANKFGFSEGANAIIKKIGEHVGRESPEFAGVKLELAHKTLAPLLNDKGKFNFNRSSVQTYKNALHENTSVLKEALSPEEMKLLTDIGDLGTLLYQSQKSVSQPSQSGYMNTIYKNSKEVLKKIPGIKLLTDAVENINQNVGNLRKAEKMLNQKDLTKNLANLNGKSDGNLKSAAVLTQSLLQHKSKKGDEFDSMTDEELQDIIDDEDFNSLSDEELERIVNEE